MNIKLFFYVSLCFVFISFSLNSSSCTGSHLVLSHNGFDVIDVKALQRKTRSCNTEDGAESDCSLVPISRTSYTLTVNVSKCLHIKHYDHSRGFRGGSLKLLMQLHMRAGDRNTMPAVHKRYDAGASKFMTYEYKSLNFDSFAFLFCPQQEALPAPGLSVLEMKPLCFVKMQKTLTTAATVQPGSSVIPEEGRQCRCLNMESFTETSELSQSDWVLQKTVLWLSRRSRHWMKVITPAGSSCQDNKFQTLWSFCLF